MEGKLLDWRCQTSGANKKRAARMLLCVVIAGLDSAIHAEVLLPNSPSGLFASDQHGPPGSSPAVTRIGDAPRE
jgi:hypothetical protein